MHSLPLLSMDYFFLTVDGLLKKDEIIGKMFDNEDALNDALEKGDVVKCLILRDMRSKAVFGWVVPSKGSDADGYAVDVLSEAIRWLGYTRLILKSDNEPAIVKLLEDTMAAIRVQVEEVKPEHSQPYDSQANGSAENAIRNLRGMLRTFRSCREERFGMKLPIDHPIMH